MANEKRLIDANALIFHLGEEPMVWSDGEAEIQERNDWRRFKACVEAQDTVNAVEVIHAMWEEVGVADYKCSRCGFRFTSADPISMFRYCRCGAKMDGERKDNG